MLAGAMLYVPHFSATENPLATPLCSGNIAQALGQVVQPQLNREERILMTTTRPPNPRVVPGNPY